MWRRWKALQKFLQLIVITMVGAYMVACELIWIVFYITFVVGFQLLQNLWKLTSVELPPPPTNWN